jgi:uncharacterized membrane protein
MPVPSHSADRGTPVARAGDRFLGLDQARALAIIAMMVFHFAPGLFIQIPSLEPLRTPVLWFGRTATPAFATVFGITAGFVLLPRYVRGDVGNTPQRLRRRAGLILLCAIAITVPLWAKLLARNVTDFWPWAFGLYSVLLFYALGFLLLPLWLRWLQRQTAARAVISGVALWTIGTIGYELWPQGAPSSLEFARMMLLSGSYGYFQMMGTALLAIPLGWGLRQALESGTGDRFLVSLLGLGVSLAVLGAAWGRAVGEYDLARIIGGELRVPARPWYFLHFGALALVAMVATEFLTRSFRFLRTPGYILALFGQASLLLYTGHAFVLPALEWTGQFVTLRGPWRAVVPFLPFAVFCAAVLYARHRQLQGKKAARVVTAPLVVPPSRTALRVLANPVRG